MALRAHCKSGRTSFKSDGNNLTTNVWRLIIKLSFHVNVTQFDINAILNMSVRFMQKKYNNWNPNI